MYSDDISLPTYPVEPSYSDTKAEAQKENTTNVKRYEVMVILGTTDEIRGTISVPESISFKHYKNGLLYEKTIEPEELQSVAILEYSKSEAGSSGTKKFFKFEPSLVEVKLKDGTNYKVEKIFAFLKSFVIETVNGKTKLYTFFGDSYETKKGWNDVSSKDPEYHKNRPHPASVRKILFLRLAS